jgi:glutamine amidotransferase
MKNKVTIIDYGINNIQSVIQAFNFIGVNITVASNLSTLADATHIVLPGVGAFPAGMKKLKKLGLDEIIKSKVKQKSKILGICLGMQMLFTKSYEYEVCDGLNLIQGDVLQIKKKINFEERLPVIGWRKTISISSCKEDNMKKILNGQIFYYLHSYQVIPKKKNDIVAYYDRAGDRVNAAIASDNIWGVQFHPEKSGDAGLEFLKAFSDLEAKE